MYLDDRPDEGDESPGLGEPDPPAPKPPDQSFGNLFIGACLALLVFLLAWKRPSFFPHVLGVALLAGLVFVIYRWVTRTTPQDEANLPYASWERAKMRERRERSSNLIGDVVVGLFGAVFKAVMYLFSRGDGD
jgi:drug/metabolite transporter (DMT)-like permease